MTLFPTQPNIPSPTTAARPVTVPAPGVSAPLGADDAKRARILADAIRARFAQTLVGQDNLRESLIVTLVAGGHILIESVPGLAKTTAAQTLATCVSGSFKRVQCTPDLMPSDLVGTQVFDFASQKFTTQIDPLSETAEPAEYCWTGRMDMLCAWLQSARRLVVADLKALLTAAPCWRNLPLGETPPRCFDLGLAAYLLNPEESDYGWPRLAARWGAALKLEGGGPARLALAMAEALEDQL